MPVRPQKVRAAMEYLLRVNPLHHDILIRDGNANENLLSIGSDFPESDIDLEVESDYELESAGNPLRAHRHAGSECLVVENENLTELAPGQNKEAKHILLDEKCEELAFPKYFSNESSCILFCVKVI